ncbi:cytochrome P450 [Chitinophaga solisilvae]|uniref:cytochrome P450 n=1 Tax=Chitinophaga solisilvae TaxID=1233460 RepID=UPI00136DC63E|nr:cytochrome P450 [Chitinophaga solisilvae]
MKNIKPLLKLDYNSIKFQKDPFRYYRIMQERYPLYFHESTQMYILTRYDDVELALKDPLFSTEDYSRKCGHMLKLLLLQMEGKKHTTYTRIISPSLHGKEMMEFVVPVIIKNVQALIETLINKCEFDFVGDFATQLPINVFAEITGLDKRDQLLFKKWSRIIVKNMRNYSDNPEIREEGINMVIEARRYLFPLIEHYRINPVKGLLSTLCLAEVDGVKMQNEDIFSYFLVLLTAGIDTIEKTLISLLRNLIAHPTELALVRNNRNLVNNAIAETLRLSSPSQVVQRRTVEDYSIAGGVIPAHSAVLCIMAAANRDRSKFSSPDMFDISRPDLDVDKAFKGNANHLSFGAGRHFCLGALLAKTEVNIATNILLDHFADIKFLNNQIPEEIGFNTRTSRRMDVVTSSPIKNVLPYTTWNH